MNNICIYIDIDLGETAVDIVKGNKIIDEIHIRIIGEHNRVYSFIKGIEQNCIGHYVRDVEHFELKYEYVNNLKIRHITSLMDKVVILSRIYDDPICMKFNNKWDDAKNLKKSKCVYISMQNFGFRKNKRELRDALLLWEQAKKATMGYKL